MILDFKCSSVFEKNYNAFLDPKIKIIVNQGGSRSTKTYSIIQLLDTIAVSEKINTTFTIARKELSTLRVTAMRDFFDILIDQNAYNPKDHNKSENTYQLQKTLIEFVGLDSPTKKRGAKRKHLFINEANELTLEDWRQLIMRTTGKIFLDFNPSEEHSFIYDNILTREDAILIKSTYLDNPFLEQTLKEEIERFQFEDENYWRVYGLGERGISVVKIYSNWDIVNTEEEWNEQIKKCKETTYGLDFGFNHPTACIEINENENDIYLKEIIYKSGLLNQDIVNLMNEKIPNKNKYIYADSANPDKIKEISQAGFNVHEADKSVKDGIDACKRKKFHVHKDSAGLIKEFKSYSWKTDKNGNILDEPVKAKDDAMDAMRYGIYRKESEPRVWFM